MCSHGNHVVLSMSTTVSSLAKNVTRVTYLPMWPQSQDISNLLETRYTIKYNSDLVSTVGKLTVCFRRYQFLVENYIVVI